MVNHPDRNNVPITDSALVAGRAAPTPGDDVPTDPSVEGDSLDHGLDCLLPLLAAVGLEPTPTEVADILWLAVRLEIPSQPGRASVSAADNGAECQLDGKPAKAFSQPEPGDARSANLYPAGGASVGGRPALGFRAPAEPALANALEFYRALRPLHRRVPSRTRRLLDEDTTAEHIAAQRLSGHLFWAPAWTPAREPWFELALVVDRGATMAVWRETLDDLRRLFNTSGAFHRTRLWCLETDDPEPRLYAGSGTQGARFAKPESLIAGPERRLMLVASDCVGAAWHTGAVNRWLAIWGAAAPLALLQVLPQRLWTSTALGRGQPVRLRSRQLGAVASDLEPIGGPSLRLRTLSAGLDRGQSSAVASPDLRLPVLTLEPPALLGWGRLLGDIPDAWCGGVHFGPDTDYAGDIPPAESGPEPDQVEVLIRLAEFRANASPIAHRLASLLAAAPLTLPVMRLVQRTRLPESGQGHLAEILVSGLLRRHPDLDGGSDQPIYEFHGDCRERLLNGLGEREARGVLDAVSAYVAEHTGGVLDFAALLINPDPDALNSHTVSIGDANIRCFAGIGARVLRRLGGAYGKVADELERSANRYENRLDDSTALGESDDPAARTQIPTPRRLLSMPYEAGTHQPPGARPRIFISYAQFSDVHSQRVLALAQALVKQGIDVELDQFHQHELIDWPRWCLDQLRPERSDWVLMVCSAVYRDRIENRVDPHSGRGTFWEGALIDDQIYAAKDNRRFVPVLLDDEPQESIPRFAHGLTFCRVRGLEMAEPGFETLCRLLTRQPAVVKPVLGPMVPLGPGASESADEAGAESMTLRPVSRCSNPNIQALSDELDAARAEEERLICEEADTRAVQARIVELKRRIREGGRLCVGDDLLQGRYKLIDQLDRGGFATIFKAFDRRSRRLVALKVLNGQDGDDRSRVEFFFRGARKMAELRHQGIVQVFDSDLTDEGHHFFIMEYLPGGDLRRAILSGVMPPERALDLILTVGVALSFAHARGVIHRDIKPANIVLDAVGSPKLTNFGLVRAADTTGGTLTGMMGTYLYAAPELIRPQDADVRADVFGLGMTAVFALHGQDLRPQDLLRNPDGFIARLAVAEAVKPVLSRAIAWDREERYPSVESFCEALTHARRAGEPSLLGRTGHLVSPEPVLAEPPDLRQEADHDKYWHLKIDRVSQYHTVAGEARRMVREGRPRCHAFVWYGRAGNGVDLFHTRLNVELRDDLGNTLLLEIAPRWPDDLAEPDRSFEDMLCEVFSVQALDEVPTRIRQLAGGGYGTRVLVLLRHQTIVGKRTINPESLRHYVQWLDQRLADLLDEGQFLLVGISFVVDKPPGFRQAVRRQGLFELRLEATVFRLLDELEPLALHDLQNFLETHRIPHAGRLNEARLMSMLKETGGKYESTVEALQLLMDRALAGPELSPGAIDDEVDDY